MVANPDLVAVVFACDRPPPNPRLIDRFLVSRRVQRGSGAARREQGRPRRRRCGASRPYSAIYERIGYDVLLRQREGAHRARGAPATARGPALDRHRTVGCRQVDAAQRDAARAAAGHRRGSARSLDRKGRHTTTHRRAASARWSRRRVRRGHPGHPRARPVADPADASWRPASRNSASTSGSAPSATARTCTSRAAGCATPSRPGRSREDRYDSYRRCSPATSPSRPPSADELAGRSRRSRRRRAPRARRSTLSRCRRRGGSRHRPAPLRARRRGLRGRPRLGRPGEEASGRNARLLERAVVARADADRSAPGPHRVR